MKQREQYVERETTTTGRKDYENSVKPMQLYLNSLMCTGEVEVLRSIESRTDGRYRAAQGPQRPGQAAVARWERHDAYKYSSGYDKIDLWHTNFQKGHTNDTVREDSWTEIQKRDSSIG